MAEEAELLGEECPQAEQGGDEKALVTLVYLHPRILLLVSFSSGSVP